MEYASRFVKVMGYLKKGLVETNENDGSFHCLIVKNFIHLH